MEAEAAEFLMQPGSGLTVFAQVPEVKEGPVVVLKHPVGTSMMVVRLVPALI